MPYLAIALLLFFLSLLFIVLRLGYPHRIKWLGAPLSHTRCRRCDGLGVMVLYHGKLIPIPPHMRDRDPDNSNFTPPLANAVRCPRCHGVGHVWSIQGHRIG